MAPETKRNIFLGVVALIAIGLAYYFFVVKPKNESSDQANQPTDNSGSTNQPSPQFNAGDDVYVPPLRVQYLYIYSYPQTNPIYEVGRTTNALVGSGPLGKFISMEGNGKFVRVSISGKTFEKKNTLRPGSYDNAQLNGEYYVLSEWVKNKPY